MAKKKEKKTKPKKVQAPAKLPNPLKVMMPNYAVYYMSTWEKLSAAAIAFLVGAVCSQVFYGGLFKEDGEATTMTHISAVVLIVLIGLLAVKVYLPIRQEQLRKKRQLNLRNQFRDMLESMTASLSAGDTVFSAFQSAYTDMKLQYGDNADIVRELEQILTGAQNRIRIEVMLEDFGKRSGLEDVESFADVFAAVRDNGPNMGDVMRHTHDIITEKMSIADEIDSKVSANKLELNVITVAPVALVMMLRATNDSMAEQFASFGGVVCMTIAIGIFIAAYILGQKILDIR
ncbi:MAG: hypothetical protein LUJ09_00880 [Firmicutes bacterium]|nr:hypothetical protein [Bacillota bacterium]